MLALLQLQLRKEDLGWTSGSRSGSSTFFLLFLIRTEVLFGFWGNEQGFTLKKSITTALSFQAPAISLLNKLCRIAITSPTSQLHYHICWVCSFYHTRFSCKMMVIAELNNDSDTTWKQASQLDQNHCIVSSFFPVDRKISWFILEKYTHKRKERKESQNPNNLVFCTMDFKFCRKWRDKNVSELIPAKSSDSRFLIPLPENEST